MFTQMTDDNSIFFRIESEISTLPPTYMVYVGTEEWYDGLPQLIRPKFVRLSLDNAADREMIELAGYRLPRKVGKTAMAKVLEMLSD